MLESIFFGSLKNHKTLFSHIVSLNIYALVHLITRVHILMAKNYSAWCQSQSSLLHHYSQDASRYKASLTKKNHRVTTLHKAGWGSTCQSTSIIFWLITFYEERHYPPAKRHLLEVEDAYGVTNAWLCSLRDLNNDNYWWYFDPTDNCNTQALTCLKISQA